ncbi:PAS domain-containing protein [Magnetospirillum sulfuroxidans]|uniref:PAS domain-containing protein n=1 Tax=Magnetospirillum sulfuroxidans TaxID=611300 RepID=A0ABS5I919_9PROT|nr:PAS domain-containing protein [Magnetospirillum sulfuroxidans]MBR9970933.1 PAS domain-containing protein [Magnetospirillum sulfuroxidans]
MDRIVTGTERTFPTDEIIVSKTDTTGRIIYANDVFIDISGYRPEEVLGQPHSMIRHPDMPRAVFKLLWDRISQGHEVFAYVVNRSKNGDHYWVLAHVTPSVDAEGKIIGYHSCRRAPKRSAVDTISALYARLRQVESTDDRKAGLEKSSAMLLEAVTALGFSSYDRFVLSLGR